jgi:hypothetical protein
MRLRSAEVARLHERRDGGIARRGGNTPDPRSQGADEIDRQDRRVVGRSVEGQYSARQPEGQGGHDKDSPSVHGIADRATDARPEDQGSQLGQADGTDLQRGRGHRVHLEGDRHQRQLAPEHRHQLAGKEEAEIATPPQRVQVDEDPIGHPPMVRPQVHLNATAEGWVPKERGPYDDIHR